MGIQSKRFLFIASAGVLASLITYTRAGADSAAKTASPQIWTEKSASEKEKSANGFDVAAFNRTFVKLANEAAPTVVNIFTTTRAPRPVNPWGQGGPAPGQDPFQFFFGDPFGANRQPPQQESRSLGSGFVINKDGVIVTNSHVVRANGRDADDVRVKFAGDSEQAEGREAKIVGVDEDTDVAIVRLVKKPNDLKAASLGNSDTTQVGEWVIAIGNPLGHAHTVTKGIVSALGRTVFENSRANFIQTDASINPGNSGGPLFNMYGEVIGINTAIDARAQGIGFAIPINVAKNVIPQLLNKGEVTRGWLGVALADMNPQIAKSLGLKDASGALVQEVFPGEPASKAGLQAYDVVVDVDGKKIENSRDFRIEIGNKPIGSSAKLGFLREGHLKSTTVTIARRKAETELAKRTPNQPAPKGKKSGASAKTGLAIAELTNELRGRLGLDGTVTGVLVSQVAPGSPADAIGIAPGDVIREINRKPIKTIKDAEVAFSAKTTNFLLKLQRRTASVIVLLDLNEEAEQEE